MLLNLCKKICPSNLSFQSQTLFLAKDDYELEQACQTQTALRAAHLVSYMEK
jgi:hypothetical protein